MKIFLKLVYVVRSILYLPLRIIILVGDIYSYILIEKLDMRPQQLLYHIFLNSQMQKKYLLY